MRYHKLSLTEIPQTVGVGNHDMDRELIEWFQPPDRWLLLLLWHSGILHANGIAYPFIAGTRFVIPARTRCRIERTGVEDTFQFWTHFVPTETRIGEVAIPFQSTFSERVQAVKQDVMAAMDMYAYDKGYARSIFWMMLWSAAEDPVKVRTSIVVERAEAIIEERIGGELRVAELASVLMVSHNHLTRQFVKELGVTPQEYIRNLRLSMAVRLLTTTTTPIKRIAVRVGVPDLRQFNRLVKDRLGMPPRRVRSERQTQDVNKHSVSEEYQRWNAREGGEVGTAPAGRNVKEKGEGPGN